MGEDRGHREGDQQVQSELLLLQGRLDLLGFYLNTGDIV
jgi:hypothetical protein